MRSIPALATLPLLLSIAACDYYFNGPGHRSHIASPAKAKSLPLANPAAPRN